ncbi:MAG: glycosyltransferase [Peptococcaceae bacterium]|jgi:glycosyltransferase involved in cell wall biosynthesis|nr:glycosyltransferase [Peptococcaceae bacterium]
MAALLRDETIVCLAAARWSGMWARAQQFMVRLAGENRVLFVEPPVTFLAPLKQRENLALLRSDHRREGENLAVFRPPGSLPFGNLRRGLNRVNMGLLAGRIHRELARLGWRPTLLWTCLPGSIDLAGAFPDCLLLYDCADEHASFPGFLDPRLVADMEGELLSRADVALVSAGSLYRARSLVRPDLLLVPNAADVGHFGRALDPECPVPPDLAGVKEPIIGYIGAVSPWLDIPLLGSLADACPGYRVVLVGPVDCDVSELGARPNVTVLGHRSYRDLPAYLKAFAVAVIPFALNDLTRAVNPVKLYEYLAAGVPVVSTALPEVVPFSPLVAVGGDSAEFINLVRTLVARGKETERRARLDLARANSWEERLALVGRAVARKRGIRNFPPGR